LRCAVYSKLEKETDPSPAEFTLSAGALIRSQVGRGEEEGEPQRSPDLHIKVLQQDVTSQWGCRVLGCKQTWFHCFVAQNISKVCTHKPYILEMKICLWSISAFSVLKSSAHRLRSPVMGIDSCGLLFDHRTACL